MADPLTTVLDDFERSDGQIVPPDGGWVNTWDAGLRIVDGALTTVFGRRYGGLAWGTDWGPRVAAWIELDADLTDGEIYLDVGAAQMVVFNADWLQIWDKEAGDEVMGIDPSAVGGTLKAGDRAAIVVDGLDVSVLIWRSGSSRWTEALWGELADIWDGFIAIALAGGVRIAAFGGGSLMEPIAGAMIMVHDGAGWVPCDLRMHDSTGWVQASGLEVL